MIKEVMLEEGEKICEKILNIAWWDKKVELGVEKKGLRKKYLNRNVKLIIRYKRHKTETENKFLIGWIKTDRII